MPEAEIIALFEQRYLNSKTNNFIFTGINTFEILDDIPDKCDISMSDSDMEVEAAENIKIDMEEVNVKDILSYALQLLKNASLLDASFDYSMDFNSKFDLLRFQGVLRNYNRVVQLIFYNMDELSLEDQALFNEIYYFNSMYFNANSFIKGNNFPSYFLSNGRILDNRENYTKIKIFKSREGLWEKLQS